ncbi:hypothetical protein EZS27_003096 [termite gut metagenome]|uniref:Uncharacterized protein n=1 Tax=termite gut metagenome TaxID=433724 RepID=A0A5J4STJ1_9ZZZZ
MEMESIGKSPNTKKKPVLLYMVKPVSTIVIENEYSYLSQIRFK